MDSAAQQAAQSAQSGYARPMAAGAASFAGSQSAGAVNSMGDQVLAARAASDKQKGEGGFAESDVQASDTSNVGGGGGAEGGAGASGGGGSAAGGGGASNAGVDVADTKPTDQENSDGGGLKG